MLNFVRVDSDGEELSEYEKKRLNNIRQNQDVLKEIFGENTVSCIL